MDWLREHANDRSLRLRPDVVPDSLHRRIVQSFMLALWIVNVLHTIYFVKDYRLTQVGVQDRNATLMVARDDVTSILKKRIDHLFHIVGNGGKGLPQLLVVHLLCSNR